MKVDMPLITEKDVLKALETIIDPDFNKDIVSLGFVKNIKIEGKSVAFDIVLTTPACPVKDEFEKQAKAAIHQLNGIENVSINMISRPKKNFLFLSKRTILK